MIASLTKAAIKHHKAGRDHLNYMPYLQPICPNRDRYEAEILTGRLVSINCSAS